MTFQPNFKRLIPILVAGLALALSINGAAEARRGGSFGSRGTRTYSAPPPTRLAPAGAAPIQRSMTARPAAPTVVQPGVAAPIQRPGFFNRFGGGLLGGLLVGGLIGGLMGHGFGMGGTGLLTMLIQLAVIALLIWMIMRLFRRGPAVASDAPLNGSGPWGSPAVVPITPSVAVLNNGAQAYLPPSGEIRIDQDDMAVFERILIQVQDAFAREDYAGLRNLTTPEVMSFLAEELSTNATQGRKNDVSATRLLQADLAEAWREPDAEYATVAMRFESIDVMRDRQTGCVVEGDPSTPSQTTEIWTFVRKSEEPAGPVWKLSAIQDTEPTN
jgi:predicted lipid-binding transport protein (Tim44 family)